MNDWHVDIITMSFGFRERSARIHKAIKHACSVGVIIFVATSNDGNNEDITFPASAYDSVIGVHSTDGLGKRSNFTPYALEGCENFSILGEAVESSWPKHLKQGSKQFRSGTSYATPIAAGTAANMLLYVRMKVDDEGIVEEAASCRGMKKLLKLMTRKDESYSCVSPWKLWDKGEIQILAQIRTAFPMNVNT